MKNSPTQELHAAGAELQAQLREGGFPVQGEKKFGTSDRIFCLA